MKRFWSRPERMLDALVIGIALPTITIVAVGSDGWKAGDRSAANDKAAAAMSCDPRSGNSKTICARSADDKLRVDTIARFAR